MNKNLLCKYDRPVPRYTSYPTAPQFHAGITADVAGVWLSRLTAEQPVSLYLHVPYCKQLCWYCGCNMKVANDYAKVQRYADALIRDIQNVAAKVPARLAVSHLHWGGGTPTSLSPEDFSRVCAALRQAFDFAPNHEHAVEIDPRTLSDEHIATLAHEGVTRVSLGVQDFDPAVQAAINRIQPYELTAEVMEKLRSAGIRALNFDLIYGLPNQTEQTILTTVAQTAVIRPNRVALFGYAHVPWMKRHQKLLERFDLPDGNARMRLMSVAREALQAAGYTSIGLDHFALPEDAMAVAANNGTLRRNFQGYTTDKAEVLLGFGCSAISALSDGYVQNMTSVKEYEEAVEHGKLPLERGVALSSEDKVRRALIERLMCDFAVDVAAVCRTYGVELQALRDVWRHVLHLQADGMAEVECDGARVGDFDALDRVLSKEEVQTFRVGVTEMGRPFVRVMAACFDAYFAPKGLSFMTEEEQHPQAGPAIPARVIIQDGASGQVAQRHSRSV